MNTIEYRADAPMQYPELDDYGNRIAFRHAAPQGSFSLSRAIRGVLARDQKEAMGEFAESSNIARSLGKLAPPTGFYAPANALFRMIKTTAPALGSNLVPKEHLGELFAHQLREQSLVAKLGVKTLASDGADLHIPKTGTSCTSYWLAAEDTAITESAPTFAAVTLTPKFIAGYVTVSQRVIKQSSPSAEQLLEEDLRLVIGEAIDTALLQGTGSNGQPTGLLNTAGIGALTHSQGATTGASNLFAMQATLAAAKAYRGSLRYVVHPSDAVLLAQRQRFGSTDTPLLEGSMTDASILGVPV